MVHHSQLYAWSLKQTSLMLIIIKILKPIKDLMMNNDFEHIENFIMLS